MRMRGGWWKVSIRVFIRKIMKLIKNHNLAGMSRIDLIMISITDFIILVRSGGLVVVMEIRSLAESGLPI